MTKCVVNQCCCGCTLRTGALTLAIINLIIYLLNFGGNMDLLINLTPELQATGVYGTVVTATLFAAVGALINGLLLLGVFKNNSSLVMVWVWSNCILTFINLVLAIVLISLAGSVYIAVSMFISFALNIYFIVVVRSFALELQGEINPA